MFPTCSKTHEAAFFTKNDKKMIMKKDKNTLPPLKNVNLGGGAVTIITQRFFKRFFFKYLVIHLKIPVGTQKNPNRGKKTLGVDHILRYGYDNKFLTRYSKSRSTHTSCFPDISFSSITYPLYLRSTFLSLTHRSQFFALSQ